MAVSERSGRIAEKGRKFPLKKTIDHFLKEDLMIDGILKLFLIIASAWSRLKRQHSILF